MKKKILTVFIVVLVLALLAAVAAAVLPLRQGTYEETVDTSNIIWSYNNPRTDRSIVLHDAGGGNVTLQSVKPVLNFWGNRLVRYDIAEQWEFHFSSSEIEHVILGYEPEEVLYEGTYFVEIECREQSGSDIVPRQFYFGYIESEEYLEGSDVLWLEPAGNGFTFVAEGTPTVLLPAEKTEEEETEDTGDAGTDAETEDSEEEEGPVIECVRAFEVV